MSTPNPYAAPRAPVADSAEGPGNFVPAGRAVAAARGWRWIADAWELFRRQPGAWIGLVIVALLIFIGMTLVPLLGSLASAVLTPVFVGGIFVACREQDQGRYLPRALRVIPGHSARISVNHDLPGFVPIDVGQQPDRHQHVLERLTGKRRRDFEVPLRVAGHRGGAHVVKLLLHLRLRMIGSFEQHDLVMLDDEA